jgi:orotidine-5'-phosphate decarboxylase
MAETFLVKLGAAMQANKSLVCVGLDPELNHLPKHLGTDPGAILAFNRSIIEATADVACAYKPNLAFYEVLGAEGWRVLSETVKAVPSRIPVIGDCKRGDVGHSAAMYARAMFETLGFDAITVSPYLGQDAAEPFLAYREKGVFFLCRTSNAGAAALQELTCNEGSAAKPLFLAVAGLVNSWNTNGNCGLGVGATAPSQLAAVRAVAPALPLLIPGVGAQGGDLEATMKASARAGAAPVVINSSRAIIYASNGPDFAQAARDATVTLRNAINRLH